jgi:GNAT superfamily N-acetyltransferase
VTVRSATPADARAIAEVQVETWRATYVDVMPQSLLDSLDVAARERSWERFADAAEYALFVAERDDRVVGFVSVGPSRDPAGSGEVYAIYVTPGAWSTGKGLALMNAGVTWLAERWPEAVLWVAEQNPRARRFYERYGWTLDGGRKLDEVAPDVTVAEVRYRLSNLDPRLGS